MSNYQLYKSSGVEWIGNIPSSWNSEPLKFYFNYTKGSNGQKLTKTFIDDNPGIYPVYSGMTENDGVLGFIDEFEFDYSFPLIFTTTVGSRSMTTKILNGKFSLSQNCLVMIMKKECNTSFIQYFFSFDFPFRKLLLPTIFQPSLRMEDLDQYKIIIPPIQEQNQIVQFLDEKTNLIDRLISTKEIKITLLKEQRTSLINQVVTKGLNLNVKMKESGVEFIGEIPESWIISKLKYNGVFFSGYSFDSGDFISEGEIRVIKISNIQNNGISWDDLSFVPTDFYDTFKNFIVQKGDLIFVLTRPIISTGIKICFYDEDYKVLLNQRNSVYRPNSIKLNKIFTYYLVRTMYFFEEFKQQLKETNQPNISTEQISNIKIFLPPIEEQLQIVEFLDFKTKEINDLVQLEQKKIDILKEYRQSLISEVVTGKIKVTTDE
jgi:type I restriction enzyme S subunit